MCKNVALEAGPLAGLQNICFCAAGNTYKSIAKKNITENKEIRFTNEGKVSNDTLSGFEELIRP